MSSKTIASERSVCFVWLEHASPRLLQAQQKLEESIVSHGLSPLRFPGGKTLTPLGEVLNFARKHSGQHPLVWCNSDVILTRNPFDVPDLARAYGFHRRETPSGEMCTGVDMYYLPLTIWDDVLSRDIPRLYIGASFVDWWISRKLEALNVYSNLSGYIDHPSHGKSGSASDSANIYYRKNLRNFNSYAKRNGLSEIPAPPFYLPPIGYFWGFRDGLQKLFASKKTANQAK